MISPLGFEIKVGQKWKEVDPRFDRVVVVTELRPLTSEVKVGRRWAQLKRFNGKRSGYTPYEP